MRKDQILNIAHRGKGDEKTPLNTLGAFENATFEERAISLLPGDLIFLYTDGVTDVIGHDGSMFELPRLIELMHSNAHNPASKIVEAVRDSIETFADPEQPRDDLTMLAVRVHKA